MTENTSFKLHPFQRRVLKHIMNGERVLLQAPTGAGKTLAALMPFLQNLAQEGDRLPLTCRYAVPMRVLANQFFREYHEKLVQIDSRAPTRLDEKYRAIERKAVAVQTGEQPDDPQLEAALTFCTIDQLLASFLAIPYSMGASRANLNVAAVAGSYLVLDEFHLYPLGRDGKSIYGARTTALQMLQLFMQINTPFVLMTATFSSTLLNRLATLLKAQIVTVEDDEELRTLAQGRTRTISRSPVPMRADTILADHRQRGEHACTLVICNTVSRAQQWFLSLKQAEEQGTRVVLLHSRFSSADRKRLSEEIEQTLGKAHWSRGVYQGRHLIVVATQVVEVGLDISVQVLHTENAPANSLIQRAGRCARFAQQQGKVIVYPLPLNEEGKEASPLPYDKDVCSATWNALAQLDGQQVGFREEQCLIDDVHTQQDEKLLQDYELDQGQILTKIFASYNTNDRGVASTLIRDVQQVQIIIHDKPDEAITEDPWRWQSFSMHPGSLSNPKRWAALLERGKDLEWVCKEAVPVEEAQLEADGADGIDQRRKTVYRWQKVTNPATIAGALIIALPRQLARYDSELGFVLLDGKLSIEANDYQSALIGEGSNETEQPAKSGRKGFGSRLTSYEGHIQGLVRAYNNGIKDDVHFMLQRLESPLGLAAGTIDQAIRLALACHDLGKLDVRWQHWALEWQKKVYEKEHQLAFVLPNAGYCFAKTDNQRKYSIWKQEVRTKRPHHACESVAISRGLIGASLGITRTSMRENMPVLQAICGAIARHHTTQASEYGTAELHPHALNAATNALRIAHQGSRWSYDPNTLKEHIDQAGDLAPEMGSSRLTIPEVGSELEMWLYFLIVRALRLADQRADLFTSR